MESHSEQDILSDTEFLDCLYLATPYLHPRIIKEVKLNKKNSELEIKFNHQLTKEFSNQIIEDLKSVGAQYANDKLILKFNGRNTEDIKKQLESVGESEPKYYKIARQLKDIASQFDYLPIKPKEDGASVGIVLGDFYIKQMILNKADLLEFATYVAFHHFLGTKSPEMDLIKDKSGDLWIVARNLTQTYEKGGTEKVKRFTRLDNLSSYKMSFKRSDPIFDSSDVMLKSVGKVILLAVLFGSADLHIQNTGLLNSKNKTKLAIVDLFVEANVLTEEDFSNIDTIDGFIKIILSKFDEVCTGLAIVVPALPQLGDKLQKNIPEFEKALKAIWYPREEDSKKYKTSLFHQDNIPVHKDRSVSFEETLEISYDETVTKLKNIGLDLQMLTASENKTIKQILEENNKRILGNFKVLDSAWKKLQNLSNVTKL